MRGYVRPTWVHFTAMASLIALFAVGCAQNQPASKSLSIQERCKHAGKDGVKLWRCTTRYERRDMLRIVLTRVPKDATVDFDDATVLSSNGEDGLQLVPIQYANGSWAVLVWKMSGERNTYLGVRQLTSASPKKRTATAVERAYTAELSAGAIR
jgi:hypothetical protein